MLAGLIAIQRQKEDLENLLELPITSEEVLDEAVAFYSAWSHITSRLLEELFPGDERLAAFEAFDESADEALDLTVDRLERVATNNLAMLTDVEDLLSEAVTV